MDTPPHDIGAHPCEPHDLKPNVGNQPQLPEAVAQWLS